MQGQKDWTLKDELPQSAGDQYATGDQWRNNSKKNEEMEPKQRQHPVVDVTGDGSKVRCYKQTTQHNIAHAWRQGRRPRGATPRQTSILRESKF